MNPSIPESDLLALIEGDLAPDRAGELAEALRADPELSRLVESLRRDRATLRASMDRAASVPALGLAAGAIAEARRQPTPRPESPAAPASPVAEPRRLRIVPVLSLLAAAAIAVLALVVFWPAPAGNDRLAGGAVGPPAPGTARTAREYVFTVPEEKPEQSGPALPSVLQGDDQRPIVFAESDLPPAAPVPVRTREEAERLRAQNQELAKIFEIPSEHAAPTPDFLARLNDAARGGWRAGLEVGGMDLGIAAELAMTRRLRIVVESSDPAALRRSRGFTVEQPGGGQLAAADSDAGEAIALNFPMDTELRGLQDALARVAESIEGDGDAVVRFEEIPEGQEVAHAARVVPSTEIDDVLWWSLPSDRWTPSGSVTVPIEFIVPESPAP